MGVRDGCEGVDLEVLVGADLGHGLDGSPVSEGGLRIVKVLISNVLQMIVVNMSNTLGDLRTRNTTI